MKKGFLWCFVVLLAPAWAQALGPHEVLLLVNRNSARSERVAAEFARLRSVPESNIVRLDIPENLLKPAPLCSVPDFTKHIWRPATNAAASRGISDHILAWVYSVDFPVKIMGAPAISITGLTFARNRVPDAKETDTGYYRSALFAGPEAPDAKRYPSQTFDVLKAWLGEDMPLPSMMLGYAGERGSSETSVVSCIRRGVMSDGTRPAGAVFFLVTEDVRTRARSWQFAAVQQELALYGITALVTNAMPAGDVAITGVLAGSADVTPAACGRYAPGSFADHLTSAAAEFETASQTKLTAWIDAGATASAGTVTEPRAIWTKFPHARLFVHAAAGCSMIESFFQAVRCPMQILAVGEPLSAPWAPRDPVTLDGPGNGPVRGKVPVTVEVRPGAGRSYSLFVLMVDGKIVSRKSPPQDRPNTANLTLDTAALCDGEHALRAVAYLAGPVRTQVFAEKRFVVGSKTGP